MNTLDPFCFPGCGIVFTVDSLKKVWEGIYIKILMDKTHRALSIRQPWAWIIVNGYKDVENRDWYTSLRGTIGIHAGKTFDKEGYEWVSGQFPDIKLPAVKDFPMGGLVGTADLVDCVKKYDSPWFFGEFGFILKNAKPITFIPCKGALSFFVPQINREATSGTT